MPINVAIVEDNLVTLEGLKAMVDSSVDLFCCGTFENAQSFAAGFKHLDVHVVLMDINLPHGPSGIECVESLKPSRPEVQFLMCTDVEDADNIFHALKVGAAGYILKNTTPDRMIAAIKDIHEGGSPMSPQIARKVTEAFITDKKNSDLLRLLTPSEKQIIELLAKGHPYKEVADKQGISIGTVRVHIRNIYTKLQVQNKTDAINKLYPKTVG